MTVMGRPRDKAANLSRSTHTLSELMYVELVTVMTSLVTALSAPKTLKRWRPEGARIQTREKHHSSEVKAPRTKWAASTKKTARSPAAAFAKSGSSSFF